MAKPRRRFTTGRAVVLLILGVGLGVTIFVAERLRPEALKLQVAEALQELLTTKPDFEDVIVGLDTGVRVTKLRIYYPGEPKQAAAEIEEIVLTVDHGDLLAGRVTIRRVDVFGITLRLRAAEDEHGTPAMPGVFAARASKGKMEMPDRLPEISIHPGEGGSRVEIHGSRLLAAGAPPLVMGVLSADAHAEGHIYRVVGRFAAPRVESVDLTLQFDAQARRAIVNLVAKRLTWERDDVYLLAESLRGDLPPVECGGTADVEADAVIAIPLERRSLTVVASLENIHGVFGNVHTSERVGLPFGLQEGRGKLVYDDDRVDLEGFHATYVSPSGSHGRIEASAALELDRVGPHMDLVLRGRGVEGSTEDLRHLLPPDVVDSIVEKFLPAGIFDFDLTVTQRPSIDEKVVASLEMRDGRFDYAGELDELTGKRFGFRYPIERCSGRFRIETHVPTARGLADIIRIEELKGQNPLAPGQTRAREVAVEAHGWAITYDGPGEHEDLDIGIEVRDLPIDRKLALAFATTPGGVPYERFELSGWAPRVSIRIRRDGFAEAEARAAYDVTLEDCRLAYAGFPFPIEKVNGRIVSRDLPPDAAGKEWRLLRIDGLKGEAPEGGTIEGHGEVRQGDDGAQLLDLEITATDITIGADLERAFLASPAAGTGVVDVWRSVRPYGFLSAKATLSGPKSCKIGIDLSKLALRGYQEIDCPITHLDGSVSYDLEAIRIDHLTGRIFDAPFEISGAFLDDGAFQVDGTVDGLVLEEAVQRILEAVAPPAARAIERLRIEPRSSFDLNLKCVRTGKSAPVDLVFSVDDLDVRSSLLDLDLVIQGGPVDVSLDRITARNLHLRAKGGEVRIEAAVVPLDQREQTWAQLDATNLDPTVHLEPFFGGGLRDALGGNARIDLTGFRAEYLRAERKLTLSGALDLRRHEATRGSALEPTGQVGFSPLTLMLPQEAGGPVRFAGVIEFRHLNSNVPLSIHDLGGELHVAEGTLSPEFSVTGALRNTRATLFDRELTGMSLNFTFRPDYLRLGNMDGKAYGGDFEADAEVYLEEPRAFRVKFQARHVRLGDLLKEDLPRGEPMSGTVEARLEFESPSGDVKDMRGRGQIRVKEGSLFRVPGLRPVLAVLSRVTPLDNEPRFNRAEADFTVTGEQIALHHCRLSTNLNDVDAEGSISIYGDLDLVVEPKVTRLIDLPRLINIPVLSTLRDLWHKVAYEIRLEGTLDSPAIRLRALPFLKSSSRPFTQSPHAGRPERVRPRLLP